MAIQFDTEFENSYSGQTDWVLRAVDDGVVMGILQFTEFRGEISVRMLKSNPEYKKKQKGLGSGIGRILVRKLQELYPETEIKPGMLTDQGDRLFKALPRRYEPSGLYERLKTKLAEVKDEIARSEKIYEDWYLLSDEERELTRADLPDGDRVQRLYDQESKLEKMMSRGSPGKWIVTDRKVKSMKLTRYYSRVARNSPIDAQWDQSGEYRVEARDWDPNPWAVCHKSVGPKKTKKFEDCVQDVKRDQL